MVHCRSIATKALLLGRNPTSKSFVVPFLDLSLFWRRRVSRGDHIVSRPNGVGGICQGSLVFFWMGERKRPLLPKSPPSSEQVRRRVSGGNFPKARQVFYFGRGQKKTFGLTLQNFLNEPRESFFPRHYLLQKSIVGNTTCPSNAS